MANIGDVFFRMLLDDRSIVPDATKIGQKAGSVAGGAAGTGFGAKFKSTFSRQNIGQGIVQGLGLAGGLRVFSAIDSALSGTVNWLGEANQAASDLSETVNKSDVVFGDNAAEVLSWSETTADAIGQSQAVALAAAATFGNLFSTIGLGKEEAAGMSMELVELASDLASFNNIDPDIALEKLRAGLSGEAEPLRALGVFLNEAAVKAKALELGLAGADGQLTESAKVQARYALILEQTTTAQGDFARTSDGLANTQRRQAAAMADLQAQVGEFLLPIVTEFAHFGVDVLLPFLREVIGSVRAWVKENKPLLDALSKIAGVLGGVFFKSLGLVIDAASKVFAPFVAAIGVVLDFVAAIVDGAPQIGGAAGKIVGFITGIPGRIIGIVGKVVGFFLDIARRIVKAISDGVGDVIEWILSIPGKILGLVGNLGKIAGDAAAALLAPFITVAEKIGEIVSNIGKLNVNELRGGNVGHDPVGDFIFGTDKPTGPTPIGPRAAGGPVRRGGAFLVGERGPEMFVPRDNGGIVPNHALGDAMSGMAGGNTTINVPITGLLKARDPFEVVTQLKRLGDFGVLTPRREPA